MSNSDQFKFISRRNLFTLGALYFFILAPKFYISGLGVIDSGIISVFLLILLTWSGRVQFILNRFLPFGLVFIFLLLLTLFSSLVSLQFGPYGHHYYFFVVPLYILVGISIGAYYSRFLSFHELLIFLLKLLIVIGALNSLFIILSFFFPEFRQILEGVLHQDERSNINYSEREIRLRGLAAGGGANQSLFLGALIVIAFGLYLYRAMRFINMIIIVVILFSANLLVGRTGILISFLGVSFILVVFLAKAAFSYVLNVKAVYILLFSAGFTVLLPTIVYIVFPDSVYHYALGFFYSGLGGVSDEGTIRILIRYYRIPDSAVTFLIGVGNGSGSFFEGASGDPGFMKMFTAVGFLGSLLFYSTIFYLGFKLSRQSKMVVLFIALFFIWFLAEFKEPFMLKGYFARAMWIFIGIMSVYHLNFFSRGFGFLRAS